MQYSRPGTNAWRIHGVPGEIGFDRASAAVSSAGRARERGEVEPVDRVVRDALEHVGRPVGGEGERLDLGGGRDAVGVGHRQAGRPRGRRERGLVVDGADRLGVAVQHLAALLEHRLGQRVVPARRRAAHRHVDVDALAAHHVDQGVDVAGVVGGRDDVEGVHGAGEAVPGEAVARRLDEHDPVPRRVERPRQRERLRHLPAADQHRPGPFRGLPGGGADDGAAGERGRGDGEVRGQGGEQQRLGAEGAGGADPAPPTERGHATPGYVATIPRCITRSPTTPEWSALCRTAPLSQMTTSPGRQAWR